MLLNCHSFFSLKYGTIPPEELAALAKEQGRGALALTDINNTSGCFPFVQECKKQNVKPVLGVEFRRDNRLLYVGIARNNKGFKELNDVLTEHSLASKPLPDIPER